MDVKNLKHAYAIAKYVRMSPIKVRRVLNQLKGCTYEEALILLEFLPYSACDPVWKVLQSAASNAQFLYGTNKKDLVIKQLFVNTGPNLKRFRPRAKGRGFAIKKPTCHITAIVNIKN